MLTMAVMTAMFWTPGVYGDERVYTVQRGETFYSIARALGIKADDLMKYNGITDPARLQTGQRLKVPSSGTGGTASYLVVRGDTLYSIARKFSVTVEAIREANSLPPNYLLKEGDSLMLPSGAAQPSVAQNPPNAAPTVNSPPAGTGVTAGTPAGAPAQNQATQGKPAGTGAAAVISSLRWPVAARELSYMTGKLSWVVITGTRAESVNSLTWGTVLSAGPYRGFGKVVIIQVDGGYLYVYGGCESLSVKEGDRVNPGSELGKLGIDVVSNKPQLFFMVYRSNAPVDPAKAPRA